VFGRYLGGFGLSLLGDQIWFVALGWAASNLGDPLKTSLVMATASIPRAALILFGGTLADRRGPLQIAMASQALRVTVMIGTACAALVSNDIWPLLAAALVFGVLDAAHMPAAAALPPQLLSRADLPAGQGIVQTLERVAGVAGAPAGGLIVAYGGLGLAATANAALFAAAWAVFSGLGRTIRTTAKTAPPPTEGTWRAMRDGLRYVTTQPEIGMILLVVTVLNLALAAPLNMGIALLAVRQGWGAAGFSWIISGFAAGAALGAMSLTAYRPARQAAAGLLWVAAGSICTAALPAFPNLMATISVAVLLGVTSGPASALLLGLVQAKTQPNYLGRVMAMVTFSALGLVPVSYTVFGLLTDTAGLTGAFIACAVATAGTVAVAFSMRVVRTAHIGEA
jgi:MFS family permease